MSKERKTAIVLITVILTLAMSVSVAYADESVIEQQIRSGFGNVYGIIQSVTLPVCAVMAAIHGLRLAGSSDDQQAGVKAKAALVKVALAMAIVYLAPYLVKTVEGWFDGLSSDIFS